MAIITQKSCWALFPIVIEQFWPQFIYFFTFWYSVYIGVYPVPLRLFIRTSKTLMRLSVFFLKIFRSKMFLLCSYFPWNLNTCQRQKLLLVLIILSNFYIMCERATGGDSLHARCNFWCLIMASIKFDVVCNMSCYYFVSKFYKTYQSLLF